MQRQTLVVLGRHRPHELVLLILSILWGSVALLTPEPDSLVTRLPAWLTVSASSALMFSGIVGLIGCLWRRMVETGLGLELGAMLIGTAGLLLSGYALLRFSEQVPFLAFFVAFWIVANLWRAGQIGNDLRKLRSKPKDG